MVWCPRCGEPIILHGPEGRGPCPHPRRPTIIDRLCLPERVFEPKWEFGWSTESPAGSTPASEKGATSDGGTR